jgi:hypothetical protein
MLWQKFWRQKDGENERAALKYFAFGAGAKPSRTGSQISVQQKRTVLWANRFFCPVSEVTW